ncbi:hypothetical protein ACJX0J_029707, partial [Zea mays]
FGRLCIVLAFDDTLIKQSGNNASGKATCSTDATAKHHQPNSFKQQSNKQIISLFSLLLVFVHHIFY